MYGKIHADAQGYYGYLVALFLEHSFNWEQVISSYADVYFNGSAADFTVDTEAGRVNKYFAGTALLLLPFFALSCVAASLFGFPVDGYSLPFQHGMIIASVSYSVFGLFLLSRFLQSKGISWSNAIVVILTCFFGTGLFYYSISEPVMTHVYSFFVFSAFLLQATRMFAKPTGKRILILAVIFALIVLVRPSNGIIVLSLPFLAGGLGSFLGLLTDKTFLKALLPAFVVVGAVIAIQLAVYWFQVGKPIVWSYKGEGFNFSDPETINVLWSFKKGFFIYTPWALLGLVGLVVLAFRKTAEAVWLWLFLAVSVYIISCWWNWYYGSSFGMRAMIEYLPFFAFGLAFLLQKTSGLAKGVIVLIAVMTVPINLVQSYQYNKFILHWDQMDAERYWQVFLKTDKKYEGIFYRKPKELEFPKEDQVANRFVYFTDFENDTASSASDKAKMSEVYSGLNSSRLDGDHDFGWALKKRVNEIGPEGEKVLYIRCMVWTAEAFPELSFGYSYWRDDTDYGHGYASLGQQLSEPKQWVKVEEIVELNAAESEEDVWVIYPYSPDETLIFIDDIRYEVITLKGDDQSSLSTAINAD